MRYAPLANRVIMREIEERNTTGGGLWVPDIARKNKGVAFAEVSAVGPGRNGPDGTVIPVHVKPGDVVMIPRQAPAVLPLLDEHGNEKEVLMCPENDIIAIVHGLPRATTIVDRTGVPLSLTPQSLALPDGVYANREGIDEAISDLRQSGAPPDVIEEIARENVDQTEGSPEIIEAP